MMPIDLRIPITEFTIKDTIDYERITVFGHIGTHPDAMDKHSSLSDAERTP
jgi:hypothetical protein